MGHGQERGPGGGDGDKLTRPCRGGLWFGGAGRSLLWRHRQREPRRGEGTQVKPRRSSAEMFRVCPRCGADGVAIYEGELLVQVRWEAKRLQGFGVVM